MINETAAQDIIYEQCKAQTPAGRDLVPGFRLHSHEDEYSVNSGPFSGPYSKICSTRITRWHLVSTEESFFHATTKQSHAVRLARHSMIG